MFQTKKLSKCFRGRLSLIKCTCFRYIVLPYHLKVPDYVFCGKIFLVQSFLEQSKISGVENTIHNKQDCRVESKILAGVRCFRDIVLPYHLRMPHHVFSGKTFLVKSFLQQSKISGVGNIIHSNQDCGGGVQNSCQSYFFLLSG